MKKFSIASFLAICGALLIVTAALALISNGGFETGDFTGWTKTTFINNGFSATQGAGGSDLSGIVGASGGGPLSLSDAHTSGNLLYPAYGDFTARINSDASYDGGGFAKNGNVITQNFSAVLDPSDSEAHIRFVYSAVMVNPIATPHTAEQKPYFRVQAINTSNGNDVLYDFSSYVGEPGKNWQNGPIFSGSDFWQYLDWTYIDLASSPAHPVTAGDIITLKITAAGCSLGGHPGYVYVDEISDGDITGPSINATGPATIFSGQTITYTYNYFNGSGSSINPTITATQPTGVTFTSVSDTVNCSLSGGTVTCNYTGIGVGTGGSFTINGTVTAAGGSQLAHGDYNIAATGFPTVGGQTVLTDVMLNQVPVAVDNTYATTMSVTLSGSSVLSNDTDADSDPLTAKLVSGPAHDSGGFILNSNGTFSYTPVNGFQGTDTFTYMANDGVSDSNVATVAINITPITRIFRSNGENDGWVRESNETSNSANFKFVSMQLRVGDNRLNKQYRTLLDFDASSIPNNAVVVSAVLRVKNKVTIGASPFLTFGNLLVDIKKGYFGTSTSLETVDFIARPSKYKIGSLTPTTNKWYQLNILPGHYKFINLIGHTQFRLRFALDDDNDGLEDYFRFNSGNVPSVSVRPRLIIQYYIPAP